MRFSSSSHLGLLVASMLAGCSSGVLPEMGDLGTTCGASCDGGTHADGGAGTDGGGAHDGSTPDAGSGDDAGGGDDGGTTIDAGSGDDSGTTIDAGSTMDAGSSVDAGGATDAGFHRDGGMLMCTGTPTPGCCLMDSDCTGGDVCYGASCGIFGPPNSGRCLPPPDPGACWDNSDCPMSGLGGGCMGGRICPCGAPCFAGYDHQGTCSMGFPFP